MFTNFSFCQVPAERCGIIFGESDNFSLVVMCLDFVLSVFTIIPLLLLHLIRTSVLIFRVDSVLTAGK